MQRSTKTRAIAVCALSVASEKRVFWKSRTGLPNALRCAQYAIVCSSAVSQTATAVDRDREPLLRELAHEHREAVALLAQQRVAPARGTSSKNSSAVSCALQPDLLERPPAGEARHAALDEDQRDAAAARGRDRSSRPRSRGRPACRW